MILIRKILLVTSLVLLLITTSVENSWAANLSIQQPVIMDVMGETQAVTKQVEGKVQETYGNVTRSQQDQYAGQTKQFQGQTKQNIQGIQGKIQGIIDNITGNSKAAAKQAESNIRQTTQKVKDKLD